MFIKGSDISFWQTSKLYNIFVGNFKLAGKNFTNNLRLFIPYNIYVPGVNAIFVNGIMRDMIFFPKFDCGLKAEICVSSNGM